MRRKMMTIAVAALVVLSASAMILKQTYVKVSDIGCGNKCFISNEDQGVTRKCGKCGGFLNGGKATVDDNNWWHSTFTCNKCGHSSTWKYK